MDQWPSGCFAFEVGRHALLLRCLHVVSSTLCARCRVYGAVWQTLIISFFVCLGLLHISVCIECQGYFFHSTPSCLQRLCTRKPRRVTKAPLPLIEEAQSPHFGKSGTNVWPPSTQPGKEVVMTNACDRDIALRVLDVLFTYRKRDIRLCACRVPTIYEHPWHVAVRVSSG